MEDMNATATTANRYRYSSHYSQAEIRDGATGGETSYEVTSNGVPIGSIFGHEILAEEGNEDGNWVREFSFTSIDGKSGSGSTRRAAIEDAARPTPRQLALEASVEAGQTPAELWAWLTADLSDFEADAWLSF